MSDEVYSERRINLMEYRSPGPVAQSCLNSREFIRFMMGPQGSGKTTLFLFDAVKRAMEMPKAKDGNRYFAGVVIRDTYTNLWATTIKSWHKFFSADMGNWNGGTGRPASHELTLRHSDGSLVFLTMRFTALSDQSIEDALRGFECTWAYINEADRVSEEVLTYLIGRVGRYPDAMMMGEGVRFWRGIVGDVNPPDVDSWIYRRFIEQKQDGDLHAFFVQPGGRDPRAENVRNLPENYYAMQIAANRANPWWIRRMVDGKFGYSREGMPVYSTFDDDLHVAQSPLKAEPGLPLLLGFDQGITQPAMAVIQWMPIGQLRWLGEYVPGRCSPGQFGEGARAYLNHRFPGAPIRQPASCDPAGMAGEVREDAHFSWASIVSQRMQIVLQPAETNELDARIEALSGVFTYMPAPGIPGFLLSPDCVLTRKGMNSHYRYRKKQGVEGAFEPRPEKNLYANIIEAGQYAALDLFGRHGVIGGGPRHGAGPRDDYYRDPYERARQPARAGDFDVFAV